MDLSPRQVQRSADNVRIAIDRLQKFQHADGGRLGYWPGASSVNDYSTSYAGHFLLEAKRKGFDVPESFLDPWRKYQRTTARNWNIDRAKDWEQRIQAYRLLVLALDGNPEMGAMNRLRRYDNLHNSARWMLAGAYALAGQNQTADKLLKEGSTTVEAYREYGYTYGSHRRDKAMMLYIASLVDRKGESGAELMKTVADNLGSQYWLKARRNRSQSDYHSQYPVSASRARELNMNTPWVAENGKRQVEMWYFSAPDSGRRPNEHCRANRQGQGPARPRRHPDGGDGTGSLKISLSCLPISMKTAGPIVDISNLRQGQDFTARVTISHSGADRTTHEEIALDQIFPSGWEGGTTASMAPIQEAIRPGISGYQR
ncbi:MAG: hypothetical protein R3B47_06270 [Bacteroidia bacterium]